MTLTFEATYENGVIKPDRPIDLDEHVRVVVTIERQAAARPPYDPSLPDPLDAVIGIGRTGPDISLAAEHDRITYGLK